MAKFYRVKEDNFLWKKGCILKKESDDDGYRPIDDVWDVTDDNGDEYISTHIIEDKANEKYFERVYEISKGKKAYYLVKEKAQEAAAKYYESDK